MIINQGQSPLLSAENDRVDRKADLVFYDM